MANTKIYLGNLSKTINEDTLSERFAQFGEISEVLLPLDRKSKEVKGYAFITFKLEASAQAALALDGENVFGQTISVQIAIEKARGKKNND